MNSFNHYAYGAIGEWLYRVVAGLEIDEENPGYKHSIIRPHFGGGLSYVKAGYKSVYGDLSVYWETGESHIGKTDIILKVTVPHNTTATIVLDRAEDILQADGLSFEKTSEGMSVRAGSGTYHIEFGK